MSGAGAMTRGVRNNNPGNIEFQPETKWQGLALPSTDGRFCRFRSPQFGIRALARLLITYQDRHQLRTISGIITRWAPPKNDAGQHENHTAAYIARVAHLTGFGATQVIDVHRHDHLRPLVEAIISVECAGYAYPAAVVDEALTMAGVPPAAALVAVRSSTSAAAAGTAAVGVSATAIVEVAQAVGPHLGVASDLVRAAGPWVVSLLVVVAAGFFIWQRVRRQREVAA